MTKNIVTNEIILHMLGIVLVEIRANDMPKYAVRMSDVFHNVPAKLIKKIPPQEIYDDMLRVAKRHSVENYLANLLKHSSDKISKQENGPAD